MILNDNPTYYDLLELNPDASAQEIRSAYLRIKAAYKRDSVALYTLMDENETENLLRQIEEAYGVLSNPEKRRNYDQRFGFIGITHAAEVPSSHNENVVPLDRSLGSTSFSNPEEDLLIPPSTDFTAAPVPPPQQVREPQSYAPRGHSSIRQRPTATGDTLIAEEVAREIIQETEWRGPFLRRIREAKRISIEEMAEYTKISKSYLLAIEDENFEKLPAVVFLRGFITQISKAMKLPHENVVEAYLGRYKAFREESERK